MSKTIREYFEQHKEIPVNENTIGTIADYCYTEIEKGNAVSAKTLPKFEF